MARVVLLLHPYDTLYIPSSSSQQQQQHPSSGCPRLSIKDDSETSLPSSLVLFIQRRARAQEITLLSPFNNALSLCLSPHSSGRFFVFREKRRKKAVSTPPAQWVTLCCVPIYYILYSATSRIYISIQARAAKREWEREIWRFIYRFENRGGWGVSGIVWNWSRHARRVLSRKKGSLYVLRAVSYGSSVYV